MKLKLTLVAAAFWGVGLANAQSSLQIYGKLDLGVARSNNGTSDLSNSGDRDAWTMQSAQSSRLGFRGREDLGGGWRTQFRIEHRFDADTGQAASRRPFWRGRSWLSIGNQSMGELLLGRDKAPALDWSSRGDSFDGDYVGGMGGVLNDLVYSVPTSADPSANLRDDSRADDLIKYTTPRFRGFQAIAAVSMADGARRERTTGFGLNYNAGPVEFYIATDRQNSNKKLFNMALIYKFGAFTLNTGYGKATIPVSNLPQDRTTFLLGGTMKVGHGDIKASFGRAKQDDTAASSNTEQINTKFGLGYIYNMSKRTSLYATLGSQQTEKAAPGSSSNATAKYGRRTGFDVGITHEF